MNKFPTYKFLQDLFLRAPYYSFAGYDLERLQEVLDDHGFRNGLFLASPAFYKVLQEKEFKLKQLNEKERHSICKYYNRMCFRATPFGSFASFTLLTWGDGDTVRLTGAEGTSLHLLPDSKLVAIRDAWPRTETTDDLLIKNPTLYLLGQEFRFVRSSIDKTGHYRFSLEAVWSNPFYASLFDLFDEPVQISGLREWIAHTSGCTASEAAEFLDFLLTEQILYHHGTGHIIGKYSPEQACDCSKTRWSAFNPVTVKLSPSLPTIAAEAALSYSLPHSTGPVNIFYAGLERNLHSGGPGDQDQETIGQTIELLRRLSRPHSSDQLKKFITDFQARFDRERVPLLLALDPDSGISYGNFGISGLAKGFEDIQIREGGEETTPVEWTKLHSWLFGRLAAVRESGQFGPLDLTGVDFSELEAFIEPGLAPPTIAVMFRKTTDQVLIEYTGGAAATSLIGRFSVFSEVAATLCRKLAKIEALHHPDVVFADIGQLSDENTDNINRRLQIYPYEIPLNVYSIMPDAEQLKPEDLTLCVRDGDLILESTTLRKRVIPRLASAYNYKHNELAIFRLLGDLQYQGLQANLNFNVEQFFPGLNFYPRVVFGRSVINLARWHFDREEIAALQKGLREFRQRYGLPQKVSIGQFDQQMVFDLTCKRASHFFLNSIKSLDRLTVTEYLEPDRSIKIGHEPFAGQYISFLYHNEKIYDGTIAGETPDIDAAERNFLPGSNWLYIKIYCTPASADRILAGVVAPVVENNRALIRKWFFIRYAENGYHLRVRFQADETHIGRILLEIRNQLTASGHDVLVKNYQADIYKREMERYAGLIGPVEDFFHAGSELLTHHLVLADEGGLGTSEFLLGLYTTYQLINCFIDELSAVKEFTGQMADIFIKKFTSNKELKRDMDLKYRAMKPEVETLLEGPVPVPALAAQFRPLFDKATIIANKLADESSERWGAILADLVHMQLNRTFPVKQRTHEFMVYYFLNKYAISRAARVNQGS